MFTAIPDLVNQHSRLQQQGRHVTTQFLVMSSEEQYLFAVHKGKMSVTTGPLVMPEWQFTLRAQTQGWERFWAPNPEPGWHDLFAMIKFKTLVAEGDLHPFITNLFWFKEILAIPRSLSTHADSKENTK